MSRSGWFVAGALAAGVAVCAAGLVLLRQARGLSAREAPGLVETWFARQARAAIPAVDKARANPVANSFDVLVEARAHWADHCASCHANDGSGDTGMGRHL